MNQFAQKYRQHVAGIDRIRPTLDLLSLDGQKRWNIGVNRDGFFFTTPVMSVEPCLKIKKLLAVGAECFLPT